MLLGMHTNKKVSLSPDILCEVTKNLVEQIVLYASQIKTYDNALICQLLEFLLFKNFTTNPNELGNVIKQEFIFNKIMNEH
jgi:hypothetical protein